MKTFILSATVLASIVLPQVASATLLVGWHDFDGTANPSEAADYSAVGFSGLLNHSAIASSATGGNSDGTYGNLPSPTVPSGDGDARIRALVSSTLSFNVVNNSGSSVALQSLLFDAAGISSTAQRFAISYQIGTNAIQSLATVTATNAGFVDYAFNLVGILADTETLSVFMTRLTNVLDAAPNNNIRIDNIAITAIPEPGSLLAIGCVLGSGLMLRNRRRQLAVTA